MIFLVAVSTSLCRVCSCHANTFFDELLNGVDIKPLYLFQIYMHEPFFYVEMNKTVSQRGVKTLNIFKKKVKQSYQNPSL